MMNWGLVSNNRGLMSDNRGLVSDNRGLLDRSLLDGSLLNRSLMVNRSGLSNRSGTEKGDSVFDLIVVNGSVHVFVDEVFEFKESGSGFRVVLDHFFDHINKDDRVSVFDLIQERFNLRVEDLALIVVIDGF
jgi:hypothetical protein